MTTLAAMMTWAETGHALLTMALFGGVGLALMLIGFRAFDLITPRMDIERELAEKHNMAVAIVIAAVLLGVAAIVVMAMA
jgi:putative membrane protein